MTQCINTGFIVTSALAIVFSMLAILVAVGFAIFSITDIIISREECDESRHDDGDNLMGNRHGGSCVWGGILRNLKGNLCD